MRQILIIITIALCIASTAILYHALYKKEQIHQSTINHPKISQQQNPGIFLRQKLYYLNLPLTLHSKNIKISLEITNHDDYKELSNQQNILHQTIKLYLEKDSNTKSTYHMREKLLVLINTKIYPLHINNIYTNDII